MCTLMTETNQIKQEENKYLYDPALNDPTSTEEEPFSYKAEMFWC